MTRVVIAVALVFIALKMSWQSSDSLLLNHQIVELKATAAARDEQMAILERSLVDTKANFGNMTVRYNRLKKEADHMEDQITRWENEYVILKPKEEQHASLVSVPGTDANSDCGPQNHP